MSDKKWKENKEDLNIVNFDEAGQATEGVFERIFTIPSKDEKKDDFEVLEIINPAQVKEHIFVSGHLRYKLEGIVKGDYIKVEYCGKKEVSKDVSTTGFCHTWKVYKAE